MVLEENLKKTAAELEAELKSFFPKKVSKRWLVGAVGKPSYDFDIVSVQRALVDPIWDFLDRGGKRWRPALMLLACEAVGGDRKTALRYSIIPELVHNGTIMVDDVEDNSELRRGKKSTHLIFGVDVAVNAANAMYYLPLIVLFNDSKFPTEKKAAIYDLYSLEMLRLSFGQAMDISWHNTQAKVSVGQYLQMCSYKTGSLARLATQMGGILGGANKNQLSALAGFGTSLGVAFQIQDDILNLRPEGKWGKVIGDDIKEGKITLIVIHALGKLSKEKKTRLLKILGADNASDREVLAAISLLENSGSLEYAKVVAEKIVLDAWKKLNRALPSSKAKSLLKEFADYVVERKL